MITILQKIADWILEHEEKEAEDCRIPDEIVDEWLERIREQRRELEEEGSQSGAYYEMLRDLEKKVEEIRRIRKLRCESGQGS